MTETELKAILASEQASALAFMGGELADDRRKAMDYYMARPYGTEVSGRSQIVSSEVANTIEWVIPSLMKIFMGGEDVVTVAPHGGEDVAGAEQATEYANFVFQRDNPGFVILHSMFKDALLQKTGTCKIYWETAEREEQDEFIAIPPEQFLVESAARMQDGWQLANHEAGPDPAAMPMPGVMAPELHSGVWTRKTKTGKVRIDPVPPEEFLISREAKTIADARYVAHRRQYTASELIEEGYPKKIIDTLGPDGNDDNTMERQARHGDINEDVEGDYAAANHAMRRIWVTEAYIKIDWNDDGVAEMRKVTHAGNGTVILDNEEWEGPRPFAAITPILMPHRFFGRSLAEMVMDLQLLKSTLFRQILDNLYLVNNPMKIVNPEAIEIDDILMPRPGGIVRTRNGMTAEAGVVPLNVDATAAASFPMLEYVDAVIENRTGVTRYNQGLDANSLNKTATGISQIMTASQQRIELIARVFAETGVKEIFEHIIWLLRRYPSEAKRAIRLRNEKWVAMDPAAWKGDFDFSITVGLGTGNKDQQLAHLTRILQIQTEAIKFQGGASGPLVTIDNIRETIKRMIENAGYKDVSKFITDGAQPPAPAKPPPPNPELIAVQAKIEEGKARLAMDARKMQMEAEADKRSAALGQQKMVADAALKRELAMMEFGLKKEIALAELALKAGQAAAPAIVPQMVQA